MNMYGNVEKKWHSKLKCQKNGHLKFQLNTVNIKYECWYIYIYGYKCDTVERKGGKRSDI